MASSKTDLSWASEGALFEAFSGVRRGSPVAGRDRVTPQRYAEDLAGNLAALSDRLATGGYRPGPLLRMARPKPSGGVRRLAIPTVEDRIVLEAIRRRLQAVVEPLLSPAAHAYRPGRSARGAVELVARRVTDGASWVALSDIRDFFDAIRLGPLLRAVDSLGLGASLGENLSRVLHAHSLRPGVGLAQGSALSPLLSNLALLPFDRRVLGAELELVRYCDNLCVPCRTEAQARSALDLLAREATRLGHALKLEESEVTASARGFLWLGFWVGRDGLCASDGALDALRARLDAAGAHSNGAEREQRLAAVLRGWAQYFDVAIPDSVHLGAHDALARRILATLSSRSAPRDGHAAAPEPETPDLRPTEAVEPWEDADVEDVVGADATAEELLDQADRLAMDGAYGDAELAFVEAQERLRAPPPEAPSPAPDGPPLWDEEIIDTYLGLFAAGLGELRRLSDRERRVSVTVQRTPSPRDIVEHLRGETSLSILPRRADGRAFLGVLDIDGRGPGDAASVDAYVASLTQVARAWELRVIVERTGGRGAHVWVPLTEDVPAHDLAALLDRWRREAGNPKEGVRIERLPARDDEPELAAQPITLPLGLHPVSGERSRLDGGDGRPLAPTLEGLLAFVPNGADILSCGQPAEATPSPAQPALSLAGPSTAIERSRALLGAPGRLLAGCALVRHLANKARTAEHLDHSERLSLLYTLGHLGVAGRRAIHEIIGPCRNYDTDETERQLSKLGGLPMSCARLREKHLTPELAPQCACDFGDIRGGYPTPLLHVAGFRRPWREALRSGAVLRPGTGVEPPRRGTSTVATAAPGELVPTPGPAPAAPREEAPRLLGTPPHEWA